MLALAIRAGCLLFAVADPWELRSSGSVAWRPRSRRAALARLVRREKPTVIAASRHLATLIARSARGVPVVRADKPPLPPDVARDLYPELPVFAPTSALARVATLAIATTLRADLPIRPYAPRRNDPVLRPRHAP